MDELRRAVYEVLRVDQPMTVRQVFYQLVSKGAARKTENEYKSTIVRLLTDMRRAGQIPFAWITDNTRWMRKPRTHSSLEQMLNLTAQTYRRAVWDNQDVYVEIWLEKDALSGVLGKETAEWDVPLMVTRGYPSLTFLHDSADTISKVGKPSHLYYFGDHDPSGVDIPRGTTTRFYFGNEESRLEEHAEHAWYDDNAYDVGEKYAHAVGRKLPNAFGLYDMHGNAWEWCRDWYQSDLPGGADPVVTNKASRPVYRGGSWVSLAGNCRSAFRNNFSPGYRDRHLGFRVAAVQFSSVSKIQQEQELAEPGAQADERKGRNASRQPVHS